MQYCIPQKYNQQPVNLATTGPGELDMLPHLFVYPYPAPKYQDPQFFGSMDRQHMALYSTSLDGIRKFGMVSTRRGGGQAEFGSLHVGYCTETLRPIWAATFEHMANMMAFGFGGCMTLATLSSLFHQHTIPSAGPKLVV